MRRTMWVISACLLVSCGTGDAFVVPHASAADALPGLELATDAARAHPTFDQYFYLGKAELNRYELTQSRYGESHRGDAVLIFVTEDFLRNKQVKYEGQGDPNEAVPVLKLNAYRRFYTGVYPYTIMTSVFSPVRPKLEAPLKVTFSATEWCGQVFTQLNRRADGFHVEERSYFEGEGDKDFTMPEALIEDELMVRIRKEPSRLPLGALKIVPSFIHLRLDHRPLGALNAKATLSAEKNGQRVYQLAYESGRSLEITFESKFPHRIMEFKEAQPGRPTTHAKLTRSILLPYWEKHGAGDAAYRKALGLEE